MEGVGRGGVSLFWDDCPIFAGGQISMRRDMIGVFLHLKLGKKEARVAYSGHKGRAEQVETNTPVIYAFAWRL